MSTALNCNLGTFTCWLLIIALPIHSYSFFKCKSKEHNGYGLKKKKRCQEQLNQIKHSQHLLTKATSLLKCLHLVPVAGRKHWLILWIYNKQQLLGQQEKWGHQLLGHWCRNQVKTAFKGAVCFSCYFHPDPLSCLSLMEIMNTLMFRGEAKRLNCVCTRSIPIMPWTTENSQGW